MQNTILIHAPGRRQGRGALVLAYTALFALLMGIWAAIFALNGQSFIQYGDTLKQHYPFLVYYGRWLRPSNRSSAPSSIRGKQYIGTRNTGSISPAWMGHALNT